MPVPTPKTNAPPAGPRRSWQSPPTRSCRWSIFDPRYLLLGRRTAARFQWDHHTIAHSHRAGAMTLVRELLGIVLLLQRLPAE